MWNAEDLADEIASEFSDLDGDAHCALAAWCTSEHESTKESQREVMRAVRHFDKHKDARWRASEFAARRRNRRVVRVEKRAAKAVGELF